MKKVLILFAFIFLAKSALTFPFPSPWVFGDAYVYTAKTRAILAEGNFNFDEYHYGGPQIPPLYSIALLPAYMFNDMSTAYRAMLVWNAFLSTLTIFPIFLIARNILNQNGGQSEREGEGTTRAHDNKERQALLIAAAAGLLPGTWGYVPMIMSENLFFPLVAWSVYFMYRKWHIALGLTLASLMLTKATAIAFIAAYAIFAIVQFFISSRKIAFLKKQLLVALTFAVPVIWWQIVKEPATAAHFTAGYDMKYYWEIIEKAISHVSGFLGLLRLAAHEFAYYGIATWFLGIPLALAYVWLPKNHPARKLAPCIGYILLAGVMLVGLSVIHMSRFIEINPERYMIFGRYIESTVPMFIMFAGIVLFAESSRKWRAKTLGLSILIAVGTIIALPGGAYDLVANIPIWSLQFLNENMLMLTVIAAAAIGFLAIVKPKFTPVLLSVMMIGSIASMPLPFADMLRQSHEISGQISGIRDWVEKNIATETVIGFDEEKIWTHNYIRQFWALKFWLKNPVQKVARGENPHAYIISPENLQLEKKAGSWELHLYATKK